MLQEAVTKLPKEEAEYHIKRCIDSGLWIPNAKDSETAEQDEEGEETEEAKPQGDGTFDENIYSKVD